MSRDETSLPALTNSLPEGLGAQAATPGDVGEITVRWQAQEIIDVLLAESDPESHGPGCSSASWWRRIPTTLSSHSLST